MQYVISSITYEKTEEYRVVVNQYVSGYRAILLTLDEVQACVYVPRDLAVYADVRYINQFCHDVVGLLATQLTAMSWFVVVVVAIACN